MARLRNLDVIELLATVIEHLVKGEVIQMKGMIFQ
jgi:geranylgeranyl pyrophosphate synthase